MAETANKTIYVRMPAFTETQRTVRPNQASRFLLAVLIFDGQNITAMVTNTTEKEQKWKRQS
eukprot:3809039-Amphidinium_carterae.1